MQKFEVLVGGGYGAVGSHICSLLSKNDKFIPVIAGRNEEKAQALARKLNCKWKTIDLENKDSIIEALTNINIVINCYIPSGEFNTFLPQLAAENVIHYLDIAPFNNYNEKAIGFNKKAAENNITLITALGLYPDMPGLIIASNKDHFDQIDSVDIYFIPGGKMDLSAATDHSVA